MNRTATKRHYQDQNPTSIPDLHAELLEALTEAQSERQRRADSDPQGRPEWIGYERSVMIDATIAQLIRHQLPIDADAAVKAVTAAEEQATGHSDYASKWAIGCAEYVAALARAKAVSIGSQS